MSYTRNDFQEDDAKRASRIYNIEQVKRLPRVFNRYTQKLKCDWLELPGRGAPTLKMLRSLDMLGPGRFIGCEADRSTFDSLVEEYGEESEDHLFLNDLVELRLLGRSNEKVGVLNFDSLHQAGSSALEKSVGPLIQFAHQQEKELGGFALILNVGVGRGFKEEDFKDLMARKGCFVSDQHLATLGVRYGGERKNGNTRINYCFLFGAGSPVESLKPVFCRKMA